MNLSAIEYPFATPPGTAELTKVARGVYWLRMPLPFALDHINLWIIEDGDKVALIDTGLGDPESRGIWARVLADLDREVSKIVVTHFHPDHIGNAEWLSRSTNASVWMSAGEYLLAHAVHGQHSGYSIEAMIALFRQHGLDAARCEQLAARGNIYARGVPNLPMQYHRLIAGDRLDIGGDEWELIAGYGHSPEHMTLYCAARGVLISGDMLLPKITTNVNVAAAMPEEDSVSRFITSIQRFAHLSHDTLVLPSHNTPFRGVQLRIEQLVAHHAERERVLLAALDAPRTAAELLPTLFERELDTHQIMFAMSEAIAHLNQLLHKGALRRLQSADGVLRFQSTHAHAASVEA
ncbi:MAG TPA: MBL fold metallo-hydrolase [Rhodocyclaceae bacterium]|nr:MBL fold metallo-hydrolase [Rhodocyclaceae bacterium]